MKIILAILAVAAIWHSTAFAQNGNGSERRWNEILLEVAQDCSTAAEAAVDASNYVEASMGDAVAACEESSHSSSLAENACSSTTATCESASEVCDMTCEMTCGSGSGEELYTPDVLTVLGEECETLRVRPFKDGGYKIVCRMP